jgi:hypothetical protein
MCYKFLPISGAKIFMEKPGSVALVEFGRKELRR